MLLKQTLLLGVVLSVTLVLAADERAVRARPQQRPSRIQTSDWVEPVDEQVKLQTSLELQNLKQQLAVLEQEKTVALLYQQQLQAKHQRDVIIGGILLLLVGLICGLALGRRVSARRFFSDKV